MGGHEIKTGVSIGIATFPDHGADVPSLIHSADLAMYQAKRGALPFVFYDNAGDTENEG